METHVKVLGWIYLVLGAFGLLGALLVGVAGVGTGVIAGMRDATAGAIVGGTSVVIAVVAAIFSIPSLAVGWGLLQRKSWARPLAMVCGVISLFAFPFGTILGAYTLWAMFQDGTRYVLNA